MEIGLGQLGLSVDEFWDITPREFFCKQKGFFDLYQMTEKNAWQRTISEMNIHLKRKIKIEQIFKEKKKPTRIMSSDEVERLNDEFNKRRFKPVK